MSFDFSKQSTLTGSEQPDIKKYIANLDKDITNLFSMVRKINSSGGGGAAGGSNTQVQFNDSGSFGGDADLTWDKTANILGISGDINFTSEAGGSLRIVYVLAQTVLNTGGSGLYLAGADGNGTGSGGEAYLIGGSGGTTGAGGPILVRGGDGNGTAESTAGGEVQLRGGASLSSGVGGDVSAVAGAGGTNNNGGNVVLSGGAGNGTGINGGVSVAGPRVGFYSTTPIVQQVLATGAAHSVDDVITALQNLGLVKQS